MPTESARDWLDYLGTFADTFAGIGAVAAVLLSLVTLRQEMRTRERAQAALVILSIDQTAAAYEVSVTNYSSLPVRGLIVGLHWKPITRMGYSLESLQPNDQRTFSVDFDRNDFAQVDTSSKVSIEVFFVDGNGQPWVRSAGGALRKLKEKEHSLIVGSAISMSQPES